MSKYLVFAAVNWALLLATTTSTAIAVAFPQITSDFDTTVVLAGWVLTSNQLAAAVGGPVAGKAADAFGRRRIFLFSCAVYTISGVLCAISPNIYFLILLRGLQGFATAGLVGAAYSITAEFFPKSRQRSIGLLTSIINAGMVIGPTAGGWLTATLGWRSIFWLAPGGLLAIIAGSTLISPDQVRSREKVDAPGAALFAAGLATLMVAFTVLGGDDLRQSLLPSAVIAVAGIALLAFFLRYERRTESPLIELDLLQEKPFMAANIFNFTYGVIHGLFTLIPLYAVTVYAMSTIESGLIVAPRTMAVVIGSFVASFLLVRLGYRRPMVVGTVILAPVLFLLGVEAPGFTLLDSQLSGGAILLALMVLSGICQGLIIPAANNACIELLPNRVATISGLRMTFRNGGQVFGVALATVVLHASGNFSAGFAYVFFGAALLLLLSIPNIFAMPRSAAESTVGRLQPVEMEVRGKT